MGGEKLGGNEDEIQDVGSPPRGRGKGLTASASWTSTGITPAWAGKRRQDVKGYSRVWDHPRVGGEKLGKISAPNIGQGSPPRGRGKEYAQKAAVATGGITPAWAGKSLGHAVAQGCTRDHPRVGGEKGVPNLVVNRMPGSPPRGRGKVLCTYCRFFAHRITPAWAGKSWQLKTPNTPTRDHPRVGGEKRALLCRMSPAPGSPPRGRGKACRRVWRPSRSRITPAWAGKSAAGFSFLGCSGDHPRVGGEKTKKIP